MARGPVHSVDATTRSPARILVILTGPTARLVMLGVAVVAAVGFSVTADELGVDALRRSVDGLGMVGPVVFALAYGVGATLMLPASPFTIGAGVLFGPVLGTITALVGATMGATGGFLLGRVLGRGAVERFAGRRVAALDDALRRRGFVAVLLVRLVPLFPFNLVGPVAGVTGIRLPDHTVATALGIVPGAIAYAVLGGTIDGPMSPAFLAAVAIFMIVTVAGGLAARRLRRREALSDASG